MTAIGSSLNSKAFLGSDRAVYVRVKVLLPLSPRPTSRNMTEREKQAVHSHRPSYKDVHSSVCMLEKLRKCALIVV